MACIVSYKLDHESEDWTDLVNRWTDSRKCTVYSLFPVMEMETRSLLQHNTLVTEEINDTLMTNICKNDDVLFYWANIVSNWGDNEANALLQLLVQHWVTIRGFSSASSFVEKYKQKYKRTVQKSKGLGKKLVANLKCIS